MKKKILYSTICVTLFIGLINYDLLRYGYMQGVGQFKVLWYAEPIEEVLTDSTTSSSIKAKIILMQEIRDFAIGHLGLTNSNNYTSMYDQEGQDILWNLSACEPFQLKSKEWTFPVLGSFSYKGFFDLEKARHEEKELIAQGLDTRIRTVSAWSTLGWFDDPILSKTLLRSEGSLADLVIHELTHSTIFVRDSLTFNENLASFIGQRGAKAFLKHKYGASSKEMTDYLNAESDYRRYTEHLLRGTTYLDSIYTSLEDKDLKEKEAGKTNAIAKIVNELDTVSFVDTTRFNNIFKKKMPNNAYFMAYHRYTSKLGIFDKELMNNFDGDLTKFIHFYKERYAK